MRNDRRYITDIFLDRCYTPIRQTIYVFNQMDGQYMNLTTLYGVRLIHEYELSQAFTLYLQTEDC